MFSLYVAWKLNEQYGNYPHKNPPMMDLHAENQVQAFTKIRAMATMAEYSKATQKIPTDIQLNTIVMITGEEGYTWFKSFKLSEKDQQDPKIV